MKIKLVWMAAVCGAAFLMYEPYTLGTQEEKGGGEIIVTEEVQYQFQKGKDKGLFNITVESVLMSVGMIIGERSPEGPDVRMPFTGSLNFKKIYQKAEARLQVNQIRLMETTTQGDGRVFEPVRVYDAEMEKGREPKIKFVEGKGKLPVAWKAGDSSRVYFVFPDIPKDIQTADLVITYTGMFPNKKHLVFYEDRLPVEQKTYSRNRNA